MKIIEDQRFDAERALYGSDGLVAKDCAFDGPADGESAFKESKTSRRGIAFSTCAIPSGTITA